MVLVATRGNRRVVSLATGNPDIVSEQRKIRFVLRSCFGLGFTPIAGFARWRGAPWLHRQSGLLWSMITSLGVVTSARCSKHNRNYRLSARRRLGWRLFKKPKKRNQT